MTVSNLSTGYKMRPEKEPDVPDGRVVELVNDGFAATVDYRSDRLLRKSLRYEDYFFHEFNKIAKKLAVKKKDHNVFGKDPISIMPSLQEFKVV